MNLFYLSDQGDIIQTNLTCAAGSASCSVAYTGIISTNAQYPVNASSGLAAVYGGPYFTWRVYYCDISGCLSELDGDNARTSGWTSSVVGSKALHGSSIAVALQPPCGLNVFYVDSFSQLLVSTGYQAGVGWGTRKFAFQSSVPYFLCLALSWLACARNNFDAPYSLCFNRNPS